MKSLVRYLIIGGAALIALLLLLVGGALLLRPQMPPGEPPSPVLVTLLYPASGEEFTAGDYLTVTAQAIAPEALASTELFVDGKSLGSVTEAPQLASWPWQALPVGVHTLRARATDAKGQAGESQTVVVNVLPGSGKMDVPAEAGQTLEQIGAAYGVPPDQMAGSNPQLDPSQPLQEGQPVKVPTGAGTDGGGAPGAGGFNPALVITWQFKPTQSADKSYCYTSTGNGGWEKMPKKAFEFFLAPENVFKQVFESLPNQQTFIQMQCWAWFGGTLKYLGQGETAVDAINLPNQVQVSGEGFEFVGVPEVPAGQDGTGGKIQVVPPPYAMREPKDAAECATHGHPLIAPFICNTLMQAKVKEHFILVWEWQPKTCWPGYCDWMNDIGSYRVFEIDPFTKTEKLVREITNPNNKLAAVPLPWGAKCYGVRAYAKDQAYEASDIATYCPGQAPAVKHVILTPTEWLTAGGYYETGDGCGGGDGTVGDYGYTNQRELTGFGDAPGEVGVGGQFKDFPDAECAGSGSESGAVKFLLPGEIEPGSWIQKAVLKFDESQGVRYQTGVAGYSPSICAGTVGKALQSWAGLVDADHYSGKNVLSTPAYFSPLASVPDYGPVAADVTTAVAAWVKSNLNNHGLIIGPASVPLPGQLDSDFGGYTSCWSGIGSVRLEIDYVAP